MTTLGIDFGTSTTVSTICRDGTYYEVVTDRDGEEAVPSVVAFTPNGKTAIGRPARARRLIDAANSISSVKRILGKSWTSADVRDYQRNYPYEVERDPAGNVQFITRAGRFSAVEIVSLILSYVRIAPAIESSSWERVCLTVPTTFGREQRQALQEAAEKAAFAVTTLVEEPFAAALPYLHEQKDESVVAVYDFGGGTFDCSVLKIKDGKYEIIASGGDSYLGGDDIDLECANFVADEILEQFRWDVRSDANSFQTLRFVCEQAKINLSRVDRTLINLTPVDEVLRGKSIALERPKLEQLSMNLIQRTFMVCDDVFVRAGITAQSVDKVILAGGGSLIPVVQAGVQAYFGKTPTASLPPDRIVSMGAALFVA